MKLWKKQAAAGLCALFLTAAPVSAANIAEQLLYGAAAMAYVSEYYSSLDNNAQSQFYDQAMEETGVSDDPEANARVQGIYEKLKSTGLIKRDYKIYVAPSDEINAFMSMGAVMGVNTGTLDAMDDDELAYVMAHELAHGEKRHSLSGIKKQVGLTTALNIYLSSNPTVASSLLANVAGNYISKAVFTKDQEKEADEVGFEYLVAAGYNPGGASASMQLLYERYGDQAPTGIQSLIQPSDHPGTKERAKKNLKRLYEYSAKHVNVKDGEIEIDGKKTFAPQKSGRYTAEQRTYLVAGKLAALYHDNRAGKVTQDGTHIYCAGTSVYTLSEGENGAEIAKSLNDAISPKAEKADEKDKKES